MDLKMPRYSVADLTGHTDNNECYIKNADARKHFHVSVTEVFWK